MLMKKRFIEDFWKYRGMRARTGTRKRSMREKEDQR